MSILCDPWFSEGAYDGAWYHYPPVNDPLSLVGRHDWIYISHIHPDHYDPKFLRNYLTHYPDTKILIADFAENFLSRKMQADGIEHEICSQKSFGQTEIRLFPNGIDSALAMKSAGLSIVNMNDNLYNADQIEAILAFTGRPDIALLSHTGAGPYPQTYFDVGPELEKAAAQKREEFFRRYLQMRDALSPRKTIPFAGQYVLGGKLAYLNPYRGVSDPVEVCAFDPNAVVLDEGGSMDAETLEANSVRTEPYDQVHLDRYLKDISTRPMDYEKTFSGLDPENTPWVPLLISAYQKALTRLEKDKKWWVCLRLPNKWFCMHVSTSQPEWRLLACPERLDPRIQIWIDHRYLYGLITRYYHWNNAEIGSQFITRRHPDIFDREVQGFMHFFHI